jgi:uncharacterized protein (DUF362 family)
MTHVYSKASGRIAELVKRELRRGVGDLRPRRIVLKPNWVVHETDPLFAIQALVTDARVIEAAAEACLEIFPDAESILVGDCPLQYADWPALCRQSGLTHIIERLTRISNERIEFRDLRKEVFQKAKGSFLTPAEVAHGDPRGYTIVSLGERSHLEPISNQAARFAVNDYDASATRSNHQAGCHNYYVAQSFLDADLLINLPKWKAHQKSAVTGALKNLVGINGDKAYLPHFRRGAPKWGGDEYRDENRWLYWLQTTLRERLQKKNRLSYTILKTGWEALKRVRGIETRLENRAQSSKHFYVAGGAWPGNDTIWRMIYDLNLVIQCADRDGKLRSEPQRNYFCIVDGLISGEGNGPLEPLRRETDWLLFGSDPFAIDAVLCWCMGFAPEKTPIIAHRSQYGGVDWGRFELNELKLVLDEREQRLLDVPVNFGFVPPPGWRNYLER